jgi:hypothetical protein
MSCFQGFNTFPQAATLLAEVYLIKFLNELELFFSSITEVNSKI